MEGAWDQRLHAMDYLEYAYLQSGRVQKAKAVLDEQRALPPIPGPKVLNVRARKVSGWTPAPAQGPETFPFPRRDPSPGLADP